MSIKTIEAYLSGGAANTNPNLSLGGALSTEKLATQTTVYDSSTISGVTLGDASGLSTNKIQFTFTGTLLGITDSPETTPVVGIDVSVDGTYILTMPDGSGTLEVTVDNATLPGSSTFVTLTATTVLHNLFDLVTQDNSKEGDVNYRHLYFKNISAGTLSFVVTIKNQLNGMDYLELGVENAVSGNTDTLLADENTAPVGVSFAAPSVASEGVTLTAIAGERVGVFFKRTVVALTDISTPEDIALIEITEVG